MDERNYLYHAQLNLVKAFRPKISIIENVPGMRNAKVLVGDDAELRNEIENLWQALENYKGKKAALRKINKIDETFEAEGKALKKRKELLLKTFTKFTKLYLCCRRY
ncbi:hypothetical protein [Veillonella rogosae]|uniref:hypothetical protein n=1 Tax=Veillonella rogosae TaxID=423477 RepID=UPI002092EAE2|nr:hypothetical protein [Veillonella rogosae]